MSKASILERIRNNKPDLISLPDLSVFDHNVSKELLIADFIKTSTGNMSTVVNIIGSKIPLKTYIEGFISENYPTATSVYDALHQDNTRAVDFSQNIDLFIAEAKIGVAENACLWLDDSILKQRIAAFASQHTLLIINHQNIVPTMHQAYETIQINENGYGVFIAGPSKTADIEQSLVVGAQGAVSNTIILI